MSIRCPYCGDTHRHGATAGHRVAHCEQPTRASIAGYIIPAADEPADPMADDTGFCGGADDPPFPGGRY